MKGITHIFIDIYYDIRYGMNSVTIIYKYMNIDWNKLVNKQDSQMNNLLLRRRKEEEEENNNKPQTNP